MKPSFTLLELVIVIIIIGILVSTVSIFIPNDNLRLAADNLAKNIRFTKSLALKDDKYQPFPNNDTSQEENRSKYWFRRFWQIKIAKNQTDNFYFVVYNDDDLDNNPDVKDMAKDPLTNKYINGNYYSNTSDKDANLSTFGITNIAYRYKSINSNIISGKPLRIYFDNYGNVYINKNNNKSLNIFNNMKLLTSKLKIILNQNNKSIMLIVTSNGLVYIK